MDEALIRHIIEMLNTTKVKRIGYSDRNILIIEFTDGREITFEPDGDYDSTWLVVKASGYSDQKPPITWVGG